MGVKSTTGAGRGKGRAKAEPFDGKTPIAEQFRRDAEEYITRALDKLNEDEDWEAWTHEQTGKPLTRTQNSTLLRLKTIDDRENRDIRYADLKEFNINTLLALRRKGFIDIEFPGTLGETIRSMRETPVPTKESDARMIKDFGADTLKGNMRIHINYTQQDMTQKQYQQYKAQRHDYYEQQRKFLKYQFREDVNNQAQLIANTEQLLHMRLGRRPTKAEMIHAYPVLSFYMDSIKRRR